MDFLLFCTWKAKRTEVKRTKVELNWSEVKISSWSVFFRQIRQTKWFNFSIFIPFLNAYQTIKQKQEAEHWEFRKCTEAKRTLLLWWCFYFKNVLWNVALKMSANFPIKMYETNELKSYQMIRKKVFVDAKKSWTNKRNEFIEKKKWSKWREDEKNEDNDSLEWTFVLTV